MLASFDFLFDSINHSPFAFIKKMFDVSRVKLHLHFKGRVYSPN